MKNTHCPACGRAGVVVGLDCVLRETSPAVRPHACGVGGPGATVVNTCQSTGQHHSDDLIEVYSGSTTPTYWCGYHESQRSGR